MQPTFSKTVEIHPEYRLVLIASIYNIVLITVMPVMSVISSNFLRNTTKVFKNSNRLVLLTLSVHYSIQSADSQAIR